MIETWPTFRAARRYVSTSELLFQALEDDESYLTALLEDAADVRGVA